MARTKLYDLAPIDAAPARQPEEPAAEGELSDAELEAISGGALLSRSVLTFKSTSLSTAFKGLDPYAMG